MFASQICCMFHHKFAWKLAEKNDVHFSYCFFQYYDEIWAL